MYCQTGRILHVQVGQGKVRAGLGIQWDRVFYLVHFSEDYVLFLTNSNTDPKSFIVIVSPPGPKPAAYPLPNRPPPRLCWGAGRGSSASYNGYPVPVVVVVVFVIIVVVPVTKVDLGRRL